MHELGLFKFSPFALFAFLLNINDIKGHTITEHHRMSIPFLMFSLTDDDGLGAMSKTCLMRAVES